MSYVGGNRAQKFRADLLTGPPSVARAASFARLCFSRAPPARLLARVPRCWAIRHGKRVGPGPSKPRSQSMPAAACVRASRTPAMKRKCKRLAWPYAMAHPATWHLSVWCSLPLATPSLPRTRIKGPVALAQTCCWLPLVRVVIFCRAILESDLSQGASCGPCEREDSDKYRQ